MNVNKGSVYPSNKIYYDAAEWVSVDPILPIGVTGIEIDTGKMKAGDGSSRWSSLKYANPEKGDQVKRFVANLAPNGVGNPVVTILENTLGVVPTITRTLQGRCTLTATGKFPDDTKIVGKTCFSWGSTPVFGQIGRSNNDSLNLRTFDNLNAYADIDANVRIEITVYP